MRLIGNINTAREKTAEFLKIQVGGTSINQNALDQESASCGSRFGLRCIQPHFLHPADSWCK
jgi:hypothetical protein